jgi:DNA-directed RNA polymerase specialized sigma24 family protein
MESDQLAEKQPALAGAQPTKHPLKEMPYRMRDPELVADTLMRAAAESRHLISRSEFSKLYLRFCRHTICSLARRRGLHEELNCFVANRLPGIWWNADDEFLAKRKTDVPLNRLDYSGRALSQPLS